MRNLNKLSLFMFARLTHFLSFVSCSIVRLDRVRSFVLVGKKLFTCSFGSRSFVWLGLGF